MTRNVENLQSPNATDSAAKDTFDAKIKLLAKVIKDAGLMLSLSRRSAAWILCRRFTGNSGPDTSIWPSSQHPAHDSMISKLFDSSPGDCHQYAILKLRGKINDRQKLSIIGAIREAA